MNPRILPLLLASFVGCSHPPGPSDVTSVVNTEGIAVAGDGTVYYSQNRSIGRWRVNEDPDPRYAPLPNQSNTVWGIALDPVNQRIFAGSPSARNIFVVDLRPEEPTSSVYMTGAGAANGLVLAADGTLYYTDFDAGHVFRVTAAETREQVTTAQILRPNGLAFDKDGTLYVLSFTAGTLLAITLADGKETARRVVADKLGEPDGFAFDALGRAYVTDYSGGRLFRLNLAAGTREVLRSDLNAPANIAFSGVGDIFVASSGALIRLPGAAAR